jgi:hypothetical protein
MMYEYSSATTDAVARSFDASSLRPVRGTRTPVCLRIPFEHLCTDTGLGTTGRRGVLTSQSNEFNNFLGRATDSASVLSGNVTDLIVRPNIRIFAPALITGISEPDGDNERTLSMLKRVKNLKEHYEELYQHLKDMEAARVVHYLQYTFNSGNTEIEIDGVASTPTKMMHDLPGLQNLPSWCFPISFWGGPPGKVTWYNGTLLTMLLDKLMRAADLGDTSIVSRFLTLVV